MCLKTWWDCSEATALKPESPSGLAVQGRQRLKLGLDALAVEALLLQADMDRGVDLASGKSGYHLISKVCGAIGTKLEL